MSRIGCIHYLMQTLSLDKDLCRNYCINISFQCRIGSCLNLFRCKWRKERCSRSNCWMISRFVLDRNWCRCHCRAGCWRQGKSSIDWLSFHCKCCRNHHSCCIKSSWCKCHWDKWLNIVRCNCNFRGRKQCRQNQKHWCMRSRSNSSRRRKRSKQRFLQDKCLNRCFGR